MIGLAVPAAVFAGGLQAKAQPVPPVGGFNWTGFYIGGHVGGARQNTQMTDTTSCGEIAGFFYSYYGCAAGYVAYDTSYYQVLSGNIPTQNSNDTSFLGGGQIGANYQVGRLVFGTEFDFSWTGLNSSSTAALPLTSYGQYLNSYYANYGGVYDNKSFSAHTSWIATATTRLGVAANNWLLYGKAGAAWENAEYTLSHAGCLFCTNEGSSGYEYPPFSWSGMTNDTRIGWTVGVGLEWAFSRNWTAKLEYDYMNFGTKMESFSGIGTGGTYGYYDCYYGPCNATNISTSIFQQVSEVKAGINYKFEPGNLVFW